MVCNPRNTFHRMESLEWSWSRRVWSHFPIPDARKFHFRFFASPGSAGTYIEQEIFFR